MHRKRPIIQVERPILVLPQEVDRLLCHAVSMCSPGWPWNFTSGNLQAPDNTPRFQGSRCAARPRRSPGGAGGMVPAPGATCRNAPCDTRLPAKIWPRYCNRSIAAWRSGTPEPFGSAVLARQPSLQLHLRHMARGRGDAQSGGPQAGHDACPGGRTDGRGRIGLVKPHSSPCQPLDVGRFVVLGPAEEGCVAPPQIIGKYKHNVRYTALFGT